MLIVSKKEADKTLVNSLFKPVNGHTLNVSKFDNGKYEWTGKAKDYIGKEVIDIPGVYAVYPERRKDKDGSYCQLMCISE